MPARRRLLFLALGLVLALVAGCGSESTPRTPGDAITEAEADTLSQLLHADFEAGGADFTLTAPYAEGTVLTLIADGDHRLSRPQDIARLVAAVAEIT